MKRTLITIIGILLISLSNSFAQNYTTKVETIFESGKYANTEHVKSAVDSKGKLYVVFLDGVSGIPYFATNKSGVWKYETLEYFDDDYNEITKISTFPNIAIDKKDNISIVMFGRYKNNLIYATKHVSKSEWKFSSSKETSHLQKFRIYGKYTDMCTDKNGGLHIICQADNTDKSGKIHDQSSVYFYKPFSGKWKSQMIIPGVVNEFAYGEDPSIASFGDMVYVSLGGSNHLHFGEKNISGGQWNIEELFYYDNSEINTQKFETSLCLSPNGSPNFAFYEYFAEQNYKYHGLNIMSKSKCGKGTWKIDQSIPDNVHKRRPAVGIDNNKTYLAFAGNRLHLYAKSCECTQKWELLYKDNNIGASFIDMVIDEQNIVHAFYTYEKKVFHLTAKPQGSIGNCNYRPSIAFSGKTNVGPGEEWSCKITTSDPECDPVKIYSIILPDKFKLTDHGNGTATVKGITDATEGFGDITFVILCNDDKHPGANAFQSKVSIKLKYTQKGIDKGSIKYDNNCAGSVPGEKIINDNSNQSTNTSDNNEVIDNNTGTGSNADCEKFLVRYEAFAVKYVPVVKNAKANPTDMQAATELGELMEEFASYSSEWVNLYDCHKIPGFQKRYDAATKKIKYANK